MNLKINPFPSHRRTTIPKPKIASGPQLWRLNKERRLAILPEPGTQILAETAFAVIADIAVSGTPAPDDDPGPDGGRGLNVSRALPLSHPSADSREIREANSVAETADV